jgi:ComF family protein
VHFPKLKIVGYKKVSKDFLPINDEAMDLFMHILSDLLHIFYPRVCLVCSSSLTRSEKLICRACDFKLPRTRFHDDTENPVTRVFWGRIRVTATAFLYFKKENMTQKLLHKLKYHGRKDVGIMLGELFAQDLCQSYHFRDIDVVIPVPLHPKKKRKRGYNQSASIGQGIAAFMDAELDLRSLIRNKFTQTQTRKSRMERWENVQDIFELRDHSKLEGKRILIIDDVITTGATMESCLQVCSAVRDAKLYAAAIGFATD